MMILSVSTITDLRAYPIDGLVDGQQMYVTSYAAEGDNGGGFFYWNAAAVVPDDGGINIVPGSFNSPVAGVVIGTGDGVTAAFSYSWPAGCVVPGSVSINAGPVIATDNGAGLISGPGAVGGVNYLTTLNINFTIPPAIGTPVTLNYNNTITAGRWIRPYSGSVHSNWFGAVADGVTDASPALNCGIYYSIQNNKVFELDGLSYLINEPLIIYGYCYDTAGLVSLCMKGQKTCDVTATPQTSPPRLGTQILCNFNNTFALCLQGVRGYIGDIVFIGQNNWQLPLNGIINNGALSNVSSYVVAAPNGGPRARDAQYSPYAGIVIDPFSAAVTSDGGYPGYADFYQPFNTTGNDSGNLILERVYISNFVVGLMIEPISITTPANTTNISCHDCRIQYNKVNVATGGNNMRNLYWYAGSAAFAFTNFDGMSYGDGEGCAFKLFGCYVGYSKYLFAHNSKSGSNFYVSALHAENFESIGFFGQTNNAVEVGYNFDGCEFSPWTFGSVDASITPLTASTPSLIYAAAPVLLENCHFTSATNYNITWKNGAGKITQRPFPYRIVTETYDSASQGSANVTFKNTTFSWRYGDFPLAPSFNKAGEIGISDNLRLENCIALDANSLSRNNGAMLVTDKIVATNAVDYNSYTMPIGCELTMNTAGGATSYQVNGSSDPDRMIALGSITITLSTVDLNAASFPIKTAGNIRVGDLVYTTTPFVMPNSPTTTFICNTTCIGIVTAVDGIGLIATIQGVPQGFANGNYVLYLYWWPRYLSPTSATTVAGSTALTTSTAAYLKANRRINGAGIPPGTYIVSGSKTSWVMSQAATASASGVRIYDANMIQFSGTPV